MSLEGDLPEVYTNPDGSLCPVMLADLIQEAQVAICCDDSKQKATALMRLEATKKALEETRTYKSFMNRKSNPYNRIEELLEMRNLPSFVKTDQSSDLKTNLKTEPIHNVQLHSPPEVVIVEHSD
jgi:hypothetical protein